MADSECCPHCDAWMERDDRQCWKCGWNAKRHRSRVTTIRDLLARVRETNPDLRSILEECLTLMLMDFDVSSEEVGEDP